MITQESDGSPRTSRPRPAPSSRRADESVRCLDQSAGRPHRRAARGTAQSRSVPAGHPHDQRNPWNSPRTGDSMTIRVVLDCALQRADLKSARRSPWSADAGVTPTTIRLTRGQARWSHEPATGRTISWLLKGLQRSSESDGCSAPRLMRLRRGCVMAPTRSSPYVCRLLGSIWKSANELPRPSHKCYVRVARRRRQGPQARGSGSQRSEEP